MILKSPAFMALSVLAILTYTCYVVESKNLQGLQALASKPKSGSISATFQPTTTSTSTNIVRNPQQPTVINHRQHHHHQPQQHHHLNRLPQSYQQQQMLAGRQSVVRPLSQQTVNHNHVSVCVLPDHLRQQSRCDNRQEDDFKRTALAEFQSKLKETSSELRQLLASYREEFRTLSLDLVLFAKDNTLKRLLQYDLQQHYESTRHLFDSMYSHLTSYETISHYDDSVSRAEYPLNSVADINHEIGTYFNRLHLIQVKRLLDQRLSSTGEVDLECLTANLQSQQQVEQIFGEILSVGATSQEQQHLPMDQMKLTLSIKQSLEFARTLLSSLTLANEMFNNLTHRSAEWLPKSSCHQALMRMSVCQQCYPSATPTNRSHPNDLPPPCEPYCLNVVRGCMNDIYELNRFWSDHISSLSRFKTNMIQMNNIENVMSSLDEKLVNFIIKLKQQYNSTDGTATITSTNQFVGSTSAKVSETKRAKTYKCILACLIEYSLDSELFISARSRLSYQSVSQSACLSHLARIFS